MLYMNQSFPPYGVSLNSITDCSTEFLLSKHTSIITPQRDVTLPKTRCDFSEKQEGVKLCLDRANGTFISYDKMVISLRGGEL